MSDALRIARWCWPEHGEWYAEDDSGLGACTLGGVHQFWADVAETDEPGCVGVHAAELVLIERGLAEEYGSALLDAIYESRNAWSEGETAALCATAPLAARVRAILAVIDSLPKEGT